MGQAEPDQERLLAVLAEAQHRGFIGGDLDAHVAHSLGFLAEVDAVAGAGPVSAVDLGSGGGLPGLVLAWHRPAVGWFLIDASLRRTDWLGEAVSRLGLGEQVEVVHGRAELLAHDRRFRGNHDLVVTRSFGPPAVVAECAAPFLRVGGRLVVSEPPGRPGRWEPEALATLGLRPAASRRSSLAVFEAVEPTPERFPRKPGTVTRRPLF